MADFRTHVTTSTVLGAVYGISGHVHWGLPPTTCVVAAGLCGVAGMLPDVDSDTGITQRELMTFLAAVTPMLLLDRLAQLGFDHEQMVLAGGCIYVLIRFGFAEVLRRYTVHRGMWHSIPAAVIAGLIAALLCSHENLAIRLYKVAAVVLGYVIHLLLDELWAMEWSPRGFRFKNSFGTAFKLFSRSWWANISTYGKLCLVAALVYGDPMIMKHLERSQSQVSRPAAEQPEPPSARTSPPPETPSQAQLDSRQRY